jgi:hypothetical protein
VNFVRRSLAVWLLILAALEGGLRTAGFGNPVLYQSDRDCGYLLKANQRTHRFFTRTQINSAGMRSPELTLQKPETDLRLMFVGDSITYGTTQVDQQDIFAELIRTRLSHSLHRPVDEVNASANGWAISNEYGFLRSRGIWDADFVVLVLNSGDLSQPFSSLTDSPGTFTSSPRTAIGELVTRVLLKLYHAQDAGTSVRPDADVERNNLEDLSRIAALVQSQGGKLVLVFVPFRRDIPPQMQSSAPASITAWAKKAAVDLLDLTAVVSAYSREDVTLRDGMHYNKTGNDLIATAIQRYLEGRYPLNSASPQELSSAGAKVEK